MNVKNSVLVLGVIFLAIGLLGFFNDPLFGIFDVNSISNIIHLLTGVIAVATAMNGEESARSFSRIFGVVYTLLAVLGFILPGDVLFGLMPDNLADNFLHLVFGLAFLALGYAGQTKRVTV